jgi:phage protein U
LLIGSWGNFVFEVSSEKLKTFYELNQESSGRWAEHVTINTAPVPEFLGPDLDKIDIKMIFSLQLGVNPRDSYEAMRAKVRTGEYFPLILQGRPLSMNYWSCLKISGASTIFVPGTGEASWMQFTASFKEYN